MQVNNVCLSVDTDDEESEDASDDGVISQYYNIEIIYIIIYNNISI